IAKEDCRVEEGIWTRPRRQPFPQTYRTRESHETEAAMIGSCPMDDREFVAAFEACEIANTEFHHADHIRLAWIYLRKFGLLDAFERFTTSLRRFAAHHGKPERYHET